MAEKRKRVVLDFNQKLEIIKRLKKGETATSIAQIYGIGRTTVNDIKRNAEKIEQHVSKMQSIDGDVKTRKTMKPAKFDQLDNAMYQWFIQVRSQGITLSGPIIMTKAVEMNKKLEGDPNFKASIGWLDKFKFRHGIQQLDISGEKLSANSAVVNEFKEQLNLKISKLNLIREQVYNCDETRLIWKALPQKTLASLSEKTAPGCKVQNDRITVMFCANATGNHRLPLLVIGKSKNVNMNTLPVNYYVQKSAWMDQTVFSEWFHNVFVPQVRAHMAEKQLPQEALLLMDNAPTHPTCELKSDDGKIACLFLPMNTTPLIQPMGQGIIENVKQRYRKAFIEGLLSSDDAITVKEFWKRYNIKDAVFNVTTAWADLTVSNLKNGWNKLLPEPIDETEETETVSVDEIVQLCNSVGLNSENITPEEITDWLECDKMDGGFDIFNDDEIVSSVTTIEEEVIADDEGSVLSQKPTASHSEAETMLSKCIDWFEMQEEANATQILLLRKIQNIAAQKARDSKTQEMTDYFQVTEAIMANCADMQEATDITWIKQELDTEDEINTETVSGLNVRIKEEQDSEVCAKGFIHHYQATENVDKTMNNPGEIKTEQLDSFGENGEIHSKAQHYIPPSRLEYLQKNKMMSSDHFLELWKQDKHLDVLSGDKSDSGSDSELIDLEVVTRVTEMIMDNNTELRMTDEKTSVDQLGNSAEAYENDCIVALENCSENESSSDFMNESNSQVDTLIEVDKLKSNARFRKYKNIPTDERTHECEVCGAFFADDRKLVRHIKTHTGEKPFKCDICEAKFTAKSSLQYHTRIHTGEKPYKCDACGAAFSKSFNLQVHKRTHTGEKPYRCDICGVSYADAQNLVRHTRTHTGEKPYKCDICGAEFIVKSSLQLHKRTHTGEKPFKCETCGASFSRNSYLHLHRRTHTGEKPYKCDICGVAFASTKDLNRHVRVHTGERPFKCDVCGMGYIEKSGLRKHERVHSGEKPYKCDVCDAAFAQSRKLKSHKRIHTGETPYRCDDCGLEFPKLYNLSRHKRTHTGEKPYKCDICGVGLSEKSVLNRHKRIHSGVKPFKCDVCSAAFTQNCKLQLHKRIHTGEKPYKCDVCDVRFIDSSSLKIHTRIHTGEKPYRCDFCGVTFTQIGHLQSHKRTHTGEKPYKCDICILEFAECRQLKKHKRTHTRELPIMSSDIVNAE